VEHSEGKGWERVVAIPMFERGTPRMCRLRTASFWPRWKSFDVRFYGGVSSNSATVEDSKFAGPHKSRMRKYIINACSSRLNQCGP
jgi:hypothetical protein